MKEPPKRILELSLNDVRILSLKQTMLNYNKALE